MFDNFIIYLPVAEVTINALALLLSGLGVGMLSGLFGVGGGFVMTPMLFFLGVPANIAVATSANNVLATSVAGTMMQGRDRQIDYKIAHYMLVGGVVTVMIGSLFFATLKAIGQIDLFIRIFYVIFLFLIGYGIWKESSLEIEKRKGKNFIRQYFNLLLGFEWKFPSVLSQNINQVTKNWNQMTIPVAILVRHGGKKLHQQLDKLPQKEYFPVSGITTSMWTPILLGGVIGLFSTIMGVGGSIIAIPFMTYILKMPSKIVTGTSLYQIIFIAGLTSLMQSMLGRSLDIVLGVVLTFGGIVGTGIGHQINSKISNDVLRYLFACLVLTLAVLLLVGLFISPESLFELQLIS